MEKIAALYLAHLNPVTRAHETIISALAKQYKVYVYPVIFRKDGNEINTRTFPFPYEIRMEMLKPIYNLHPIQSQRLEISASKVKELIYDDVMRNNTGGPQSRKEADPIWEELVPDPVAEIIKRHWDIIEKFAHLPDRTVKIMGMKFPAEGIFQF